MPSSLPPATRSRVMLTSSGLGVGSYWVGTVPPMPGLLQVVCAIPPTEPDVRLSPHPALRQMVGWA